MEQKATVGAVRLDNNTTWMIGLKGRPCRKFSPDLDCVERTFSSKSLTTVVYRVPGSGQLAKDNYPIQNACRKTHQSVTIPCVVSRSTPYMLLEPEPRPRPRC